MKLKNIGIVSSIIAIVWGIYGLCILLADISAKQNIFLSKLDLVLQGQTSIKNQLDTNNEEHKKFASREWTINYVNKYFNLK